MGPDRCSRRCVVLAGHLVATVIADGAPPLTCPGVVIVQTGAETESFETLECLFRDASCSLRPDRRYGIASAHFICPSKPSDVAMAW